MKLVKILSCSSAAALLSVAATALAVVTKTQDSSFSPLNWTRPTNPCTPKNTTPERLTYSGSAHGQEQIDGKVDTFTLDLKDVEATGSKTGIYHTSTVLTQRANLPSTGTSKVDYPEKISFTDQQGQPAYTLPMTFKVEYDTNGIHSVSESVSPATCNK